MLSGSSWIVDFPLRHFFKHPRPRSAAKKKLLEQHWGWLNRKINRLLSFLLFRSKWLKGKILRQMYHVQLSIKSWRGESKKKKDDKKPHTICITVYATTAANPKESSYACYYDDERQTYLGDWYSVNWMEDSDMVSYLNEFSSFSCMKTITRIFKHSSFTRLVKIFGFIWDQNQQIKLVKVFIYYSKPYI